MTIFTYSNLACECQLKELEKLGPKKGVISQSVKDVVQSLADDDLVSKDKIGTSVSKICSYGVRYATYLQNLSLSIIH